MSRVRVPSPALEVNPAEISISITCRRSAVRPVSQAQNGTYRFGKREWRVALCLVLRKRFPSTSLFADGETTELQRFISANPELCVAPKGEYPDVHRIADIKIGALSYRVLRHVSHNERIALVPTNEPNYALPGVPLWLEGPPRPPPHSIMPAIPIVNCRRLFSLTTQLRISCGK